MRLLSPVDVMFMRMESARTPMHIGALMIFALPDDSGPDFADELHALFAQMAYLPWPFDSIVKEGPFRVMPRWAQVAPDPEYHVRRVALPHPGGERELGALVARLHSVPLDFRRPLWEAHIIEGLADRRFAFYFKAHHCAVDGLGAMQRILAWLSTSPDLTKWTSAGDRTFGDDPPEAKVYASTGFRRVIDGAKALAELTRALTGMARGANSTVRAALSTPKASFNTSLTQQRRVVTAPLPLSRLRAIAHASGTTVNDVTLAVCGAAIRQLLLEQGTLPDVSLTASVPVGFERDDETLNAATGFVCPLGTDTAEPLARLTAISTVTHRGKKEILSLTRNALHHYTVLGLLPLMIAQKSGALRKLPPLFNFTVSNVVLSKVPLYLNGARLISIAPISFLVDGYGLNVTLVGYVDTVTLGFVGCRDTIPHLQRLAAHTGAALDELERASGTRPSLPLEGVQ